MDIPRFERTKINPRLGYADPGDAFQVFAHDVIQRDFPGLIRFRTSGKDGAIDLSQTGDTRTVCECKYLGADDWDEVESRWQDVEKTLARNLSDPKGPPKGQSQYGPWFRTDIPITTFVFCTNASPPNQNQADKLEQKIRAFFHNLGKTYSHLAHLRDLKVEVFNWARLRNLLEEQPHLIFRWFPLLRPSGLVPLDEIKHSNSFNAYLHGNNLPYYSRSDHLRANPLPTGTTVLNEEKLLRKLEAGDVDGVVISGRGGVGKTRLLLELGRMAANHGWLVFQISGPLALSSLDALRERLSSETKALLLFDYVEKQPNFEALIENIRSINDTYAFHVCYAASCRSGHYASKLRSLPRHEHASLSGESETQREWLRSHQRETVNRILAAVNLLGREDAGAVCRDIPVLAVFLAHLHASGRRGDLNELLQEQDFGPWVVRSLQQSDAHRDVASVATLIALFPMSHASAGLLGSSSNSRLFELLAQDGWIEKQEEVDGFHWNTIHDVIADRILLTHLQGITDTADLFVRQLISFATSVGTVASALFSLQRLRDQPPLADFQWHTLIHNEIEKAPDKWRSIRIELLRSDLLSVSERILLLRNHREWWLGAEVEPAFQNSLGWLVREALESDLPTIAPLLIKTLDEWTAKAAAHVESSNFLLTQGLRLNGPLVRGHALQWITERPRVFQTHFLLVAWLKCGLPPSDVQVVVGDWCKRHVEKFHFSFVATAWLDAGGDTAIISGLCEQWLNTHSDQASSNFLLRSYFTRSGGTADVRTIVEKWLGCHDAAVEVASVLIAWLRLGLERSVIEAKVAKWFTHYGATPAARHLYRAWLKSGGVREALGPTVLGWLVLHHKEPEAIMVCARWLKSGGEAEQIREYVVLVLRQYGDTDEARFLYEYWLQCGGDRTAIETPLVGWLSKNSRRPTARRVMEAWLEQGGDGKTIQSYFIEWLERFGSLIEARHLLHAWIKSRQDRALIMEPLDKWISKHGTKFEAESVIGVWLENGGELSVVDSALSGWLPEYQDRLNARFVLEVYIESKQAPWKILPAIQAWISVHGTTTEASFLIAKWLLTVHDVRESEPWVQTWLLKNNASLDARFVVAAWLEAGGATSLIDDHIKSWLNVHGGSAEAKFVFGAWFAANGSTVGIVDRFSQWLLTHDELFEADFAVTRWLDAGGDREVVREFLGRWLSLFDTTVEASFACASWLKATGELEFIEKHLRVWLGRHSENENARYVCTAWLRAEGALSVVERALLNLFTAAPTALDVQFEYKAWLDGGGAPVAIGDFVRQWLVPNGMTLEAAFVYPAWLNAGGDPEFVRTHIAEWLARHSKHHDASFVIPAWLKATGDHALVHDATMMWLTAFPGHHDASFIFEPWIECGGEIAPLRVSFLHWLPKHTDSVAAGYVLAEWLKHDGGVQEILPFLLTWLDRHGNQRDAPYLIRMISRERDLSRQTLERLLGWARAVSDKPAALAGMSQLGKHLMAPGLEPIVIATAELVIGPILAVRAALDPVCRGDLLILLSYLLGAARNSDSSYRKRIDILFLQWLRNPEAHALETKPCAFVQRLAWIVQLRHLIEDGQVSLAGDRAHVERFLRWLNSWERIRKNSDFHDVLRGLRNRYNAPDLWRLVDVSQQAARNDYPPRNHRR